MFSDGLTVGACLDRNGLRPARYKLTDDGIFSLGSEVGTINLDDAKVIEKGRLGPGEMIAVDTVNGKLLRDADIKAQLSTQRPYKQWVDDNLICLGSLVSRDDVPEPAGELDILTLTEQQVSFGYTSEELDVILKPMLRDGAEAFGSMGDDTALAVLSLQPRLLYTYFCQLFAQVTNPPIDPLREKLVMSLKTIMGWRRNLLGETPEHARADLGGIADPARTRTRSPARSRAPSSRSSPPSPRSGRCRRARTAWKARWGACAPRSRRPWTTAAASSS